MSEFLSKMIGSDKIMENLLLLWQQILFFGFIRDQNYSAISSDEDSFSPEQNLDSSVNLWSLRLQILSKIIQKHGGMFILHDIDKLSEVVQW